MWKTFTTIGLSCIIIFINSRIGLAADCRKAIEVVFEHEGGYQNSKMDGGNWSTGKVGKGKMCGGTKFGIACAYNPDVNIKDLTLEQASKIYENKQCKEIRIADLSGQAMPTQLLDLSINMGSDSAIKLMKRTINLLNGENENISTDAILTDDTIRWYNFYSKNKTQETLFHAELILTAIDRYAAIVENNKKRSVWLLGWIRRAVPNEIEEIREAEATLNRETKSDTK